MVLFKPFLPLANASMIQHQTFSKLVGVCIVVKFINSLVLSTTSWPIWYAGPKGLTHQSHNIKQVLFYCYLSGMGCLIIATGIPVYLICVVWKKKPKSFTSFMGQYTLYSVSRHYILTQRIAGKL